MITNYLSLLKPTPQDYRAQTHPSSIPLSTDGTGDPAINKIRKYLSPHRAYTNSRETSKKQMSICHMVLSTVERKETGQKMPGVWVTGKVYVKTWGHQLRDTRARPEGESLRLSIPQADRKCRAP